MGERSEERKEKYKRVRTEFEDLEIEDKALFVLEATISTVARGIEQFGRGFADEIEKTFQWAARRAEEAEKEAKAAADAETADEAGSAAGAPAANVSPEPKPKSQPKPPKEPGDSTASTD